MKRASECCRRIPLLCSTTLLSAAVLLVLGQQSLVGPETAVAAEGQEAEVLTPVSLEKPKADGEEDAKAADEQVELCGRVVDSEGKPVQGARLYLHCSSSMLEERYGMLYTTPRPEVKALSGPDGSFRFSISPSEAASENFDPANVVAMGPAVPSDRGDAGYGLAFERAWAFDASGKLAQRLASAQPDRAGFLAEKQEKVLRLVKDDFPLVGRIVNGKGQPVVGATVGVRELWLLHNDDLPGFLNAVQKENADYDRARAKCRSNQVGALLAEQGLKYLLTATGNHDGRFRLTGIGRDRIVGLLIEGPGIQPDLVYAYTRPGPTLRIEHEYHS